MKKFVSSFLIASVLSVSFLVHQPKPAQAQLVVNDPPNTITNVLTTGETIWSTLSEEVLKPLVLELADKMLRKLSTDTINWASGGFDGEAGFVNNYGELLKGTEHEFLTSTFNFANNFSAAQNQEGDTGDSEQQAQQNWETSQNPNFNNSRNAAQYIAEYGTKSLVQNDLNEIIKGNAGTLDLLLAQSGVSRNDFNNDLASGGLAAYALLGELPNSPSGLRSVVNSKVSQGVTGSINLQNQELSIPTGVLSKKTCEEYRDNADGTRDCIREVVETPGDQVAGQLTSALNVDTTSAANLSDGLVSALIQSVGRVTDGLIQNGLGKISGEASRAFFNSSEAQQTFNADGAIGFQSEYDVLGISGGSINTGGTSSTGNNGAGSDNGSGQNIYIGGPEDDTGGLNGPQIIINFQESLESNINMAEEERAALESIKSEISNASDVIFELDKCIPGPDYGWESRYEDVLPTFGNEESNQINAIGLNETRSMFRDPRVNIPGGILMQGEVDTILETAERISRENQFRFDDLQSLILTLGFIKAEILEDFNVQKLAVNENLVLFSEDWDGLSPLAKQQTLALAIDEGYYNNPEYVQGENILFTSAIENDEDAVKQAVFSVGWNLWRQETDPVKKLELRQTFHALSSSLSNQQLVIMANTKLNQVTQTVEQSYGSALDCLSFKAYAVGTDRSTISGIVNSGLEIDEKIFELAEYVDQYDPAANITSLPSIGYFFEFYRTNTVRNDAQLKTFLEAEANLQNQPNTVTVLKTSTMTTPSAIENSILGFDSQQEKEAYFNDFYPDDDFPYEENRNKLSVKEMYRVDRAYAKARGFGSAGARGLLFCRNTGTSEVIISGSNNNVDKSSCWKDWYAASKLDYELIVSGIN